MQAGIKVESNSTLESHSEYEVTKQIIEMSLLDGNEEDDATITFENPFCEIQIDFETFL